MHSPSSGSLAARIVRILAAFAPGPLRKSLGDPAICVTDEPPLVDVGGDHLAACHFRGPDAPQRIAAIPTQSAIAAGAAGGPVAGTPSG